MRDLFPGYYRPTDDEFDRLWENGVFMFDASVLLNLYRYTEGTREEFLELLDALDGRIWLPHQAALEYQKNRPAVIFKLENTYQSIRSKIAEMAERVRDELKSVLQEGRHPRLNRDELQKSLQEALESITERVEKREEEHPNLLWDDPIRDRIDDLFDGRVGEPFGEEKLTEIRDEGEERYEEEVPPGYMDQEKDESLQYGDLILWKQVLGYASDHDRPVVLVINDQKEDWWQIAKGRTIGPRPELVEEIRDEADVLFYLYTADTFLQYARERLAQEVEQDAIDEVRETREEDQAKSRKRQTRKTRDLPSWQVPPALRTAASQADSLEEFTRSLAQQRRRDLGKLKDVATRASDLEEAFQVPPMEDIRRALEEHARRAQRLSELASEIQFPVERQAEEQDKREDEEETNS